MTCPERCELRSIHSNRAPVRDQRNDSSHSSADDNSSLKLAQFSGSSREESPLTRHLFTVYGNLGRKYVSLVIFMNFLSELARFPPASPLPPQAVSVQKQLLNKIFVLMPEKRSPGHSICSLQNLH